MILNKKQKQYLAAVMWLLDDNEKRSRGNDVTKIILNRGNRCSGRTTLLAHCFLMLAKKEPGRAIRIFDHTGSKQAINLALLPLIKEMAEDQGLSLKVNQRDATITVLGLAQ